MRAYFFCNFYLSSIQQGIQSAHCVADMFMKYKEPSPARVMLHEWAAKHKVMIVLNGGNHADISNKALTLRSLCAETGYPYEIFFEDEISLNRSATCVGVVVPERIYTFNDEQRKINELASGPGASFVALTPNPIKLDEFEKQIAELVASSPLAK